MKYESDDAKHDAPMSSARTIVESARSGHQAWRRWLTVILPVAFVVLALWLLHHELRNYKIHDILAEVSAISPARIGLAAGLTLIAYLVLAGYDWLGFRYIHHPLSLHKIASAAFISYALSYNVGHTLITGGSVRYRLYSAWGLSTEDVAKVVVFCVLTFWVGVAAIAGVAFLREPDTIAVALHLPPMLIKPLGIGLLVLVAAYLLWTALRKTPLRIRSWHFALPPIWISAGQIVVTALDLVLAGTVLYVLLPSSLGLSFPAVIGIYLIAVIIGLASQVPGGLGVFETAFLHLLPETASSTAVAGALLAYRGIYYLFPLAIAMLMLTAQEVQIRFRRLPMARETTVAWLSAVVPQGLSVIAFVSGVILLFSGSVPGISSRLHSLARIVPLSVLEISHLLGSIAGAGLMVLARGIQRRLDGAYWMTVALLALGVVVSLLKGLDYEEAIILSVILGVFLPCRRRFNRRASILDEPFSTGWLVALGVVLACSVWLGLFSHKHLEYRGELWWQFAITADAPRFMRASVAVAAVLLLVAFRRLLAPAKPEPALPSTELLSQIRPIVDACPDTSANLAMLGDKSILLNDKRNAFIMYSVQGRSWVAMNGPIGPVEERVELVWRFRELVDRHGGWTVFYQVKTENLQLYLDLGLTLLKLGEEARVPLRDFSLEGSSRKGLRHTKSKAEREGCTFEVMVPEQTKAALAELQEISDQWLAEKNTREKRFSLGFFEPAYISACPVAIVRQRGHIVAFANLWIGGEKEELSIDLMRYRPDAPHGVMELLFTDLMLWGRGEGFRYFNLGMAPLSGFDSHPLAPLWNRVGGFIFRHGEHFYNFEGLREYKDKFDPKWEAKYLAAPGGLALTRILLDLSTLIGGGVRGIISK